MKMSMYNNSIKEFEDGSLLIYNSRSGSLGILEKECIEELKKTSHINNKEVYDVMVEEGFIVNEDLDEFEDFISSKINEDNTLQVTIAPTFCCNMNCPYCYENDSYIKKAISKDMSDKIFLFIDKYVNQNKIDELVITWYGGEPLLYYDNLLYLMDKMIEIKEKYNLKIYQSMITNGVFLNYERAKFLKEKYGLKNYQITLDGPKETNDKRRHLINEKSSFDIILRNMKEIVDIVNISLRTNVDKNNKEDVKNLYIILKEEGILNKIKLSISNVYKSESVNKYRGYMDDLEFSQFKINLLGDIATIGGNNFFKDNMLDPIENFCSATMKHTFAFDYEGNVYKCWYDLGSEKNRVGNLNQGNINNIPLKNKIKDYCKDCSWLPSCMGDCPRLFADRAYCHINKDEFKDIIYYYYMTESDYEEDY